MDNKSDVKAIMARFQSGSTSIEGVAGGRPKAAVHPTLSGPTVPFKKPVLETTHSDSAAANNPCAPKPSYLKSTASTKISSESRESMKPKALVSRFENTGGNEDSKTHPFVKPIKPKSLDLSHDTEQKPILPKVPAQKLPVSSTAPDIKNSIPKPPPITNKPLWSPKPENNGSSSSPMPQKIPTIPKPKSNIALLRQHQQMDDTKDGTSDVKPISDFAAKPSSFRAAQNIFCKVEEAAKDDAKLPSSKDSPGPGPAPIVAKKPSYRAKPFGSSIQAANSDPSAPKRKPLPNSLALGNPPSKPNRPPRVNMDKFKKGVELTSEGPELKKGGPPPPPASHPSSQTVQNGPPTLPPRPPAAIIQADQDDSYDDVADLKDSFGGNSEHQDEGSGSDEMYEDLEDRWSVMEAKEQEKKREKEEKRRVEQEKKDQKDREKKEQEARRKFKLSGQLQVIHKVKVRIDCKGGKNDLSIKQGETIEILRVTENPEGRWLARTQDGSYGYVKTESIEIDFDKLKNQSLSLPTQVNPDEVYDDVAPQDEHSRSISGPGVILPPPPEGDGDVYDDLDDPSLMVRVPPPPQFSPEGHADKSSAPTGDEIYDDVDSFPPPPPLNSLPQMKPKSAKGEKAEDPKKQKKVEKEEKDFRKKFKFEGEIKVLYQVTVKSGKKGSGKDLTVQAGEVLDVISNADHDKLICRNKEGKFGYVSSSNTQSEDNDIYDDIGDDCIYDND